MRVVMMGGGRHASQIYGMFADCVNFAGYLDDIYPKAYIEEIYGLPYLGKSEPPQRVLSICENVFIGIGAVGDNTPRIRYFNMFEAVGLRFPTLVHKTAWIGPKAEIGAGTVVQVSVVVDPKVVIGRNCVISNSAVIGHDTVIGDNVFVAPGVVINGSVTIGENSFLGTGAIVLQHRKVGKNCVIGAAACVTKDIDDGGKVIGIPAKAMKPV